MVNEDEEETSNNRNNKLLIEAITAKMTKMMDEKLELFRQESSTSKQTRDRTRSHARDHSDREATNSYYSSSHSERRRQRRDREERNPPRDNLSGLKIRIPSFHGTNDPDAYLDWEKKIELVFNCREYSEQNRVKVAATEFHDYALSWWDQLVTTRRRLGELPIESWIEMKNLMRRRFVPSHYHRELHLKLRNLVQGSKSVEEYFKEMETLMLRADIQEGREATMSRFMGGLNRDIIDRLEVVHYVELEELLHKAIMFEKQLKRRSSKSSYGSSKPVYQKDEKSGFQKEYKPFVKPKVEETDLKGKAKAITGTRDLKCYKCQGHGHYARDCPNRRIMLIREDGEIESEDEQPLEETLSKTEDPTSEAEATPRGELYVTIRALSVMNKTEEQEQRQNLFHSRCLIKDKISSLIVDGGSSTNVVSESLVRRIGLEVMKHPRPYKLH